MRPSASELRASSAQRIAGRRLSPCKASPKYCSDAPALEKIIGSSPAIQKIRQTVQRIAGTGGTVLIGGETGTGKELVAEAIHALSSRSARNLVCVNCAAIPDTLIESELFGHERGAFTGATVRREGLLSRAHGGTLFLDEVAEMSISCQAKILRVIDRKEVQPLGAHKLIPVDMRVVAATHRGLSALVLTKEFRSDLFYRLNVIPIYIPPLRERRDDVPDLVAHFIGVFNQKYQRNIQGLTPGGMSFLVQQDWPGNVRQLRNAIESAFLICRDKSIKESDLTQFHWKFASSPPLGRVKSSPVAPHLPVQREPDALLKALEATSWNKTKTAELLQWSRMTVYRKIAKYHLSAERPEEEDFASSLCVI